jgi:hypothetical protein
MKGAANTNSRRAMQSQDKQLTATLESSERVRGLGRNALTRGPIPGPRIASQACEPPLRCQHRPLSRFQRGRDFLPPQGDRHGCMFARACGEGRHRRVRAVIAEIINQDLVFTPGFCECSREKTGIVSDDRRGNGARKGKARPPVVARRERHHDVEAAAARGLWKAFHIYGGEQPAQQPRCFDHA